MAEDGFRLRGYKPQHPTASLLKTSRVRVRAELRPATFRSGTELEATETIRGDDLVELEFEQGLRLWLRGDEYRARATAEAKRTRGGPPADGVFEVPAAWSVEGVPGERGFGGLVLKGLKVLGLDPVQESVRAIAARFEAGKPDDPKRPGPGFYRVRPVTGAFALEAPGTVPAGTPVLVLVHGTTSSTWGSFGDLWSAARAGTLDRLRARYGDNVFALEHRSLTESVIANALALATALPDGARVDLLTHSRGGLVGELLSRANVTAGEPFDATEIELAGELRGIGDGDAAAQASLRQARDDLAALGRTLKAKGIKVGSFVRVACPALGTTLVSGKLDRWLAIVANVGGLALPGSPIAEVASALGDFIAAVMEKKTDPATLPGLAFFLPDAGLLRVLNNTERRVAGRLAVVAGEIDSKGVWGRLLALVLDRFYDGEHDLVVNTESMYGGTPRTDGNALLSSHRGPTVNHFNYFTNRESAEAIAAALSAEAGAIRPRSLRSGRRPGRSPAAASSRARPPAPRPTCSSCPGSWAASSPRATTGSGSTTGASPAAGSPGSRSTPPTCGRSRRTATTTASCSSSSPPRTRWCRSRSTGGCRRRRRPSGWRPILRRKVDDAKREGVAVRILAHSMGGLVTRAMIARHPDVWREFAALPGARFVMLGTPNGGSHAITELLVGRSETFGALALLDVTHAARELLAIVARFPGVLAMLPNHGGEDWFDPEVWARFARAAGSGWVTPAAADLDAARAFRALIDAAPIEPDRMVYVAGSAPVTVQAMRIGASETGAPTIEFEGTARGRRPRDLGERHPRRPQALVHAGRARRPERHGGPLPGDPRPPPDRPHRQARRRRRRSSAARRNLSWWCARRPSPCPTSSRSPLR